MKKDRELIQEFQNGDEEAFNELVRRYLDLVHGFFQKITDDEIKKRLDKLKSPYAFNLYWESMSPIVRGFW